MKEIGRDLSLVIAPPHNSCALKIIHFQWVGLSEQKPIFGKTNHLRGCLPSCFNNCCSPRTTICISTYLLLLLFWRNVIRLTWTMIFEAWSPVNWVTFTRCATMSWSGIVTRTWTASRSIATGLTTRWPCSPVRPHSINWGKDKFLIITVIMKNMK